MRFNARASPRCFSLSYQRDEIRRYFADNGNEMVRINEDKGISEAKVDEDGLTAESEGLQSMLADLEFIGVNCIVVLNTLRYCAMIWRKF